MEPKYPHVTVQLTGQDGNVFNIIGRVTREMKRHGLRDEANAFASEAMSQSSYDDVLVLCMQTVEVL
jgi:hypothetical protein